MSRDLGRPRARTTRSNRHLLAAQAVVVSVALTAWWASGNDVPTMAYLDAASSADAALPNSSRDAAGAVPTVDVGANASTPPGVAPAGSDASAPSAADGSVSGGVGTDAADQLTAFSDLPSGGLTVESNDSDESDGSDESDSGNSGHSGSDESGSEDSGSDDSGHSGSDDSSESSHPSTSQAGTTTSTPPASGSSTPTTTTDRPTTTTAPSNTTTTSPAPTTTAPTVPEPDGGCTVSTLLVPSCGAWLGSSTPSRDGTFDYARGLVEYEAVAQNVPDVLHFYKTGAATFPTAAEVALAERPGRQHSLLLYNWKPSTALTWREIADGAADQNISVVAEGLKRYPGRFFLAIHHEPENDQGAVGSGRTPDDYVAMYRHVVTMLRDLGVTNAVYVMNFMGFAGWAPVADAFYPGDDVVDWIAYDPYAHAGQSTFAQLLNRPSGDWPGFYAWATARAPGTPIMLGEWGFDLASQPLAPAAVDVAADTLESRFPMVKALVYWNNRTAEFDYRLGQPTATGQAYDDAYARMADDPYFNSTPVTAVVATDASSLVPGSIERPVVQRRSRV